ncbi:MAG: queuosine precursor transporter [Parvularculaceae bacterium]|nr:queuosine precursor transporter [Parvularculaceae bacterium]
MRAIETIDRASALSAHRFRYFEFMMAASCVVLVCSNIIGAGKVASLWGFSFGAGVLFFPLSYIAGDVLTEVYGYARARRVFWTSVASAAFAAGMAAFITWVPPAPDWNVDVGGVSRQEAFALNFAQAPRIVAASCLAIWAGEFVNAYVLAKMKVATAGRNLWMRMIGSTAAGQAIDKIIFYPLAFGGVWETSLVLKVMATNYLLQVGWETLLTPVTYRIVGFMKRAEGVDVYDKETDFTPFSVKS